MFRLAHLRSLNSHSSFRSPDPAPSSSTRSPNHPLHLVQHFHKLLKSGYHNWSWSTTSVSTESMSTSDSGVFNNNAIIYPIVVKVQSSNSSNLEVKWTRLYSQFKLFSLQKFLFDFKPWLRFISKSSFINYQDKSSIIEINSITYLNK